MNESCCSISLTQISLTLKGKLHLLKPTVRLTLSVSGESSYLLLEIVKDGRALAAGCLQAGDSGSRFAFAEGKTCCVSDSGTRLLRALFDALGTGLAPDNFDSLPQCLAFARNALATPEDTAALLRQLGAECDKVGHAALHLLGLDIACTLEPAVDGPDRCPFRFEGKKEVPFREGVSLFEQEGFPGVLRRMELRLALEPSLAQVLPALILG